MCHASDLDFLESYEKLWIEEHLPLIEVEDLEIEEIELYALD